MRRIQLAIEYDGSGFAGFQVQARGERTVQGVLEAALGRIPGAVPRVVAAGRTDAGVHALEMIVHYDSEDRIPVERLPLALNALLPPDVRALWAKAAPPGFHARKSARWRAYRYRIALGRRSGALLRHRVLFFPGRFDLERLNRALAPLVGEHDFAAFANREERSTRRTLYRARARLMGEEVWLEFAGSGFLRGQVRAMVGTLLEVAAGKRPPEDIPELLRSRRRADAGPTAPPQGLYFVAAGYRPWPMR